MQNETINQFMKEIAEQKEAFILQAIKKAEGFPEHAPYLICPEELNKQLVCEIYQDGIERYVLKGVPIIEFYPMEFNRTLNDEVARLHATFKYKILV